MNEVLSRIIGKYHRTLAYRFCRRMAAIETSFPIISFTFDDAPETAFSTGGKILAARGIRGTYYVSIGLLGSNTESGTIGSLEDLRRALANGHELGCHTFDHLDTWQTSTRKFVESVAWNRRALAEIFPGRSFKTFAYPKSEPRPTLKLELEKYFICCRGGGQETNVKMTDKNLLKAYFLDRRNGVETDTIKRLIDHNTSVRGWLIFATHDIAGNPSPYGCTPEFFGEVVEYASHSGSLILPVAEACEELRISNC